MTVDNMYGLSYQTITELRGVFSKYKNIKRVLIFGSRAKGNYREGSDIDFAVVGEGIDRALLSDVCLRIEELGLLYKVDVIDYSRYKSTPIGEHIDRVAKPFYEAVE